MHVVPTYLSVYDTNDKKKLVLSTVCTFWLLIIICCIALTEISLAYSLNYVKK